MSAQQNPQRLLYKIAQAYYLEELTQQEIAKRFHLSRPKVSRLLQQSRDQRIVNITLVPPSGGMEEIETRLEKKFGLDEVSVVQVSNENDAKSVARELGPAAAEILLRSLTGSETVGVAWGRSLLGMVDALPFDSYPKLTIVQMIGGLGVESSDEHSAELVRRAAQKLNAKFRLLSAPGIVSNVAAMKALKEDRHISETLRLAAKADIAVVGLGVLETDSVLFQSGNILDFAESRQLINSGAIGDILLRFVDHHGHPVNSDINSRILGLSLDDLKAIPRVMGIAGGERKIDIIRTALQSKIINVLVTDAKSAKKLCEEK